MLTYKPSPALAGPLYGKEPWPLRFHTHTFGGWCMNTRACSIIYDGFQFGNRKYGVFGEPVDFPAGPPPEDWQKFWRGLKGIFSDDGNTFPGPIVIEWASLDGEGHNVSIDLDEVFPERLVLHSLSREEVRKPWLETLSIQPVVPDILLQVDDHVIRIYMRTLLVAGSVDDPVNPDGYLRDDLILAWERTY
jgi:hypothetical protein